MKLRRAVVAHVHRVDAAALDDLLDEVGAKAVAEMTVIGHGQDQQVGLFAGFERTDPVRAADGVGGVDGRRQRSPGQGSCPCSGRPARWRTASIRSRRCRGCSRWPVRGSRPHRGFYLPGCSHARPGRTACRAATQRPCRFCPAQRYPHRRF